MLDIGLSEKAAAATQAEFCLVEKRDVHRRLRHRKEFASKADFGTAVLYAGSYGMMGAAVLAARGALRSGVGKLTVHAPRCGFSVLQTAVPEALYLPDRNENVISDMTPRVNFTAIGVGPGIGTNDATRGALETLIKTIKRPMVFDADALNIISRTPALMDHIAPGSILTPHAGEFDRIFGSQASSETRLLRALEVAHKYKVIIVLKGRYSATVRPDGKIFFNSTGSAAMATAGSGDVLTGLVTGLAAQNMAPEIAAVAAVYIHGIAGKIASRRYGVRGTTAEDIADAIGQAIESITNPQS